MIPDRSSPPRPLIHAVRLGAAGAATLLLVLAVLDSSSRVLFLVAVVAAAAIALFGPRFQRSYRDIAIIALNAFILLFAIEVASATVLSVVRLPTTKRVLARVLGKPNDLIEQHYLGLPYYANEAWSRQYWKELSQALRKTYHPYVIWRSPAFTGETLNVDDHGHRVTPGAECGDGALKVFVFGGSAIWGWGAPDWGAIPAYLQRRLGAATDRAVCVTNFGENAYVSTQSLIQLYLELQASNFPDVVIFYDGVNEVLSAHQSGAPVVHQNLSEIAGLFSPERSRGSLLKQLNTFQLVEQVRAGLSPSDPAEQRGRINIDRLSEDIAAAYLEVHRIVASLARLHDFEYAFFWQPHILAGAKPLTREESEMITGLDWALNMDDELSGLFEATYRRVAARAVEEERLFDLTGVFDDIPSQLWIDTWGHVTPQGNDVIARAIAETLNSLLFAPRLEARGID